MTKHILIFSFLFFCAIAETNAQKLRQLELLGKAEKLTSEIAARRDGDGNMAAAIQIVSDLDGLSYDAYNGVVGNVDSRPGLDIVYLQTTERVLEIYKSGFEPLRINLFEHGIRLQPRDVWKITITGEATKDMLPVTIRLSPSDAILLLDGKRMEIASTYNLSVGEHKLILEKDAYQTIEQTITVDEQHVFFEYTLQRQPDALLEITSTPAGAIAYLDGTRLGETPVAFFYKPGTYTLRLTKEGFVPIDNEVVELKLPGNRKAYTLEENVGYLTVNTHNGATVYINDVATPTPKDLKLLPQVIKIRVSMPKADDLEKQVLLNRNDHLTVDLFPSKKTATLQLAVAPFEADILLTGDAGERYEARGSIVFENIPIGTYSMTVSCNGYKTFQETVILKMSDYTNKSIKLEKTAPTAYNFANSTGGNPSKDFKIEMVFVKGGTFTMGCTSEQKEDLDCEDNLSHLVTLDDYYIGKYEVTQAQWRSIMGSNPSYLNNCDDCPVEQISWSEVQEFINKLNQITGKNYRLPSEAEWEFAARGGLKSLGYKFAGSNNINEVAWYGENSDFKTHSVGQKKPNELGIYDMSGNVWEFCNDWYQSYSSASQRNPKGPQSGSFRVIRGGSWIYSSISCYVSLRNFGSASSRDYSRGFRLAEPVKLAKNVNETSVRMHNGTAVVDVINPKTGRVWMDRNLGASRAATSKTDEAAYGDLYQWGRRTDGHEKRNSETISILSSTDRPGHGMFILINLLNNKFYDWLAKPNTKLWRNVNSKNNPCPKGYRLPTKNEWVAELKSWDHKNDIGAFRSILKLTVGGRRWPDTGDLSNIGQYGYYWSSSVDGSNSFGLEIFNDAANNKTSVSGGNRSFGTSVRCIKD